MISRTKLHKILKLTPLGLAGVMLGMTLALFGAKAAAACLIAVFFSFVGGAVNDDNRDAIR